MRFLAELGKHNNKAWFDANRARYEAHVKEPAARLASVLAPKLGEPRVMRIYRDIRFSNDKTPYKTNIGVGFGHGEGMPGVFLHVAPDENAVYGGVWQPAPPQLDAIRRAIVARPAAWKAARRIGLSEAEDALKRGPRGVDPAHPFIEDLKRKSFTAGVPLTRAQVVSASLPAVVVRAARRLAPLNAFLADAVRRPRIGSHLPGAG